MTSYDSFADSFAQTRKKPWPDIAELLARTKSIRSDFWAVLDVWCGSGRLYGILQAEQSTMHSYLWVDASGEMLRIARQDWGDFFQQTDMRELSSIWKKFDTVFFVASFHHVIHTASQKKVLEELRTLLTPDGIAVFLNWHLLTQKMREKYPNREGSVCHIPFAGNPREYYAFSQEELEQLFQEQSYRVQYSGYTQSQQNIITIGSPLV